MLDLTKLKVGQEIVLKTRSPTIASYYDISYWEAGQKFKVVEIDCTYLHKSSENADIGLQPIINGVVSPNFNGVSDCTWVSPYELHRHFYYGSIVKAFQYPNRLQGELNAH